MRTSIVLDDKLVIRAMKLAGVKTKSAAVHIALKAFVCANSQPDVRKLYGMGVTDRRYDYKTLRAGR